MANPSSYLHTPYSQNDPARSVEVHPRTDGIPLQNGDRPDVNHAKLYHGGNYNYGHWAQYCDNALHQGPSPPPVVNLEHTYHKNANINYLPHGNDQDNLVASGPSNMDHTQSAHELLDGSVGDNLHPIPDFANSSSQGVPDSPSSGTSAMESLKCLADRYLHDPGTRIDTLRMGLSPSGGRLRVTIMFDIDV
ncbi:hypothetical protein BJY52DRAFT_431118 [Lactarius psammicola]|nr:hypothetical protein BJY52DRAFT_431118 [Lactarius psammicola]